MLSSPKMFWVALKFSHYFTIGLLNAENKARDCGLLLKFGRTATKYDLEKSG